MTRSRDISADQSNLGGAVPPFTAGKNKIINGDFSIWQRGTSFTPSSGVAAYTADRWRTINASGSTTSRQTFTPGTAPVAGYEGQYYLNQTITSNNQNYEFQQNVEDARTFAGQTVTLSFWARSTVGAQALGVAILQYFGTGGSPSATTAATAVSGGSYTPTASWQRFSFTFTVPSVAGKTFGTNNDSYLWVRLWQYTTTATNTSIDIWGVQLESGNTATPFTTATGTIQGELQACQRYYWRINASNAYGIFGTALGATSTAAYGYLTPNVQMRVMNSMTSSNISLIDGTGGLTAVTLALQNNYVSTNLWGVVATAASGLTANRPYFIQANNSTAAFVAIDGEL